MKVQQALSELNQLLMHPLLRTDRLVEARHYVQERFEAVVVLVDSYPQTVILQLYVRLELVKLSLKLGLGLGLGLGSSW